MKLVVLDPQWEVDIHVCPSSALVIATITRKRHQALRECVLA